MKICPNCNANVMVDAVSCPVCRYSFIEDSAEPIDISKPKKPAPKPAAPEPQFKPTKVCPECSSTVMAEIMACSECGHSFVADSTEPLQIGKAAPVSNQQQNQAPTTNSWTTGRILALLGGLCLVIGSFLPWAKVLSGLLGAITISGMDGDGMILAIIGAVIFLAALAIKARLGKPYSILVGAVGILAVIISFIDISNVKNIAEESESAYMIVQTGEGLYICVIGAIMAAVGGFISAPAES